MPITRPPYSPEFRRQVVDLARAGRDPASLAREFEPTAETIRKWVAAAGCQEGSREKGDAQAATGEALSAAERDELARLRRENKQLRVDRLMSGKLALDEINEGFDRLHEGRAVRQVIGFPA